MKLFTNDDIRAIDRYTIDREGITSQELIHRVAEGVAQEIVERFRTKRHIFVFAGPGNNGADALAAARLLYEQGYKLTVYLFNIHGNSLSLDCRACRDALLATGFDGLIEITDSMEHPELRRDNIVIDGLFGSGLRPGGLTGGYRMLVRDINESGAWVLSIDIPSGLFADWNPSLIERNVVHANLTCAIQMPRISFFIDNVSPLVGEVKIIDIGLSTAAMRATATKFHLVDRHDVNRALPLRLPEASKADFGHALLYAGSYGMVGAALMAAGACVRSGVGKLTVHGPRCAFQAMQQGVPQAMFRADKKDIVITEMNAPAGITAIGAGCGMNTHESTIAAFESFLKTYRGPLVLDADALNMIHAKPMLLKYLQPGTVITPHAGEFDRLFGEHPTHEARLIKALEVSRSTGLVIVLKGHHSAVVRPDGKTYFNSTGNAGMATAGSGDALTGIILALLAQQLQPEVAAVAGTFIHGLAGDIAAESVGQWGMTTDDIIRAIPAAFMQTVNY